MRFSRQEIADMRVGGSTCFRGDSAVELKVAQSSTGRGDVVCLAMIALLVLLYTEDEWNFPTARGRPFG